MRSSSLSHTHHTLIFLQVRDLEARLLAEREEKGRLMEEKTALQARLMKLRDAGTVGEPMPGQCIHSNLKP